MTTVVDYFVTNSTIHIFASRPTAALECVRVECAYADLSSLTRSFRTSLEKRRDIESDGNALREILLDPLYEKGILCRGDSLLIAPHRCLHAIPFHALGEDTLTAHSITCAPSSAMAALYKSRIDPSRGCLVIKRSAEHDKETLQESFEREAMTVAAATNAVVLADDDATINKVAEAVRDKSVIHFTCHGKFDPDESQKSGLFLAGPDGRDVLCDLEAISRWDLDADLVVLAACETGLSDRHPGDELVGLLRAFTLAGARAILATLWPVHTVSTELIMTQFYGGLAAGQSPAAALREAELYVRSWKEAEAGEPTYAHPYYWAPFVLTGGVE